MHDAGHTIAACTEIPEMRQHRTGASEGYFQGTLDRIYVNRKIFSPKCSQDVLFPVYMQWQLNAGIRLSWEVCKIMDQIQYMAFYWICLLLTPFYYYFKVLPSHLDSVSPQKYGNCVLQVLPSNRGLSGLRDSCENHCQQHCSLDCGRLHLIPLPLLPVEGEHSVFFVSLPYFHCLAS